MVDYSLSNDRLIGMIQQQENKDLYKLDVLGKLLHLMKHQIKDI